MSLSAFASVKSPVATIIPGHRAHTLCVCSSALTPSSARSAPAGPRDLQGHPETAYHKSATLSLKHGLAEALAGNRQYIHPT